jgi:hypothetical protein
MILMLMFLIQTNNLPAGGDWFVEQIVGRSCYFIFDLLSAHTASG